MGSSAIGFDSFTETQRMTTLEESSGEREWHPSKRGSEHQQSQWQRPSLSRSNRRPNDIAEARRCKTVCSASNILRVATEKPQVGPKPVTNSDVSKMTQRFLEHASSRLPPCCHFTTACDRSKTHKRPPPEEKSAEGMDLAPQSRPEETRLLYTE